VLRVASVEGETFTAEVIARVQGAGERKMVERLSGELDRDHRLVRAEGLRRLGNGRLSGYRFRHILFQRYLYGLMDPVERAHLHDAVGSALEALYQEAGEDTGIIAGQLARHFREAGVVRKAIAYLQQAGERAVRMSANEEAITYFDQALEMLEMLPNSPERVQQELMLLIGLAAPLMVARGFAAPEAGRVQARARELCRQTGDTPQLFPVVWHLANYYGTRGEHRTAHELVVQLLDLAEQAGDPQLVLVAHFMGGWNSVYLGELTQARAHHERVVAAYDPQLHHPLAFQYGVDPGVASLMFLSWVLWLLGYPDHALERGQEALALAREPAHPHMLAAAQGIVGVSHMYRRDAQGAQELAEACIRLSTEMGFPYWLTLATTLRGWALIEQGQAEEGLAHVRQGMAGHQATGNELALPTQLIMLAMGHAGVGQVDEALARLDEAMAIVRRNDEVFHEAEIHRLKGEFLQTKGADTGEAKTCFRRAIEVARGQNAKSWELRATTSLCRLLQAQGKREEARQMLAEIYAWFSEGFDTADLKEAKALLEEMS
jgi:predicted ATPase